MPGPPPNPNARRRNVRTGPMRLPSEGRSGPAPAWPLWAPPKSPEHGQAELRLWRELWAMPQAVAWERMQCEREVAMHTRWSVLAECGDPKAAVEARMLADRLGLTPKALRTLMWEIVPDEVAEQRAARGATATRKPAAVTKRKRPDIVAVDPTAKGTGDATG